MPLGYVLDELPMAQGWALVAWVEEHQEWMAVERTGEGYVGQEVARSMEHGAGRSGPDGLGADGR